ncbi:hypothetical protein HMPREF9413_3230 [Paenibacillus sp. HGF7]|nr:hypothetical protein HMPREF9413_3230 [Paenibacillus sp. HGF7]
MEIHFSHYYSTSYRNASLRYLKKTAPGIRKPFEPARTGNKAPEKRAESARETSSVLPKE